LCEDLNDGAGAVVKEALMEFAGAFLGVKEAKPLEFLLERVEIHKECDLGGASCVVVELSGGVGFEQEDPAGP